MPNLPSGPGQNTADRSLSVVLASDQAALPVSATGLATEATLAKLRPVGQLTSASAGAGGVYVIAVTASSAAVDLTGANYTALRAAIVAGKAVKMKADGDIYYRWGTATGTVDEAKTAADTPLNQAEHLFAGEREDVIAPTTATFIMVKGPVATFLRITISE